MSEKHKSVLVRSCSKTDEGATEFKTSGNKPKKIKHKILTDRIFEIAKWDTTKKYCSVGYLKKFDECSALIFDISAVKELPLKQDRKTNVENKKQSAKIVKF